MDINGPKRPLLSCLSVASQALEMSFPSLASRLVRTHLRICTRGWRFFVISAAAYLLLVIASSPRGVPQPLTGMAFKIQVVQRFDIQPPDDSRNHSSLFCFFNEDFYVHGSEKNVISGHIKKHGTSNRSTITASLPFAM